MSIWHIHNATRMEARKDKHNVAVLGASGFIGQNIVRDFSSKNRFCITGYSSKDADLRSQKGASRLCDLIPDNAVLIVALAVRESCQDSLAVLKGNTEMAENLALLISRKPLSRVIFLSTIDVYGRHGLSLPLNEDSPVRPESYYAISKYFSELVIRKACLDMDVPSTILRLPGVYGPGDKSKRIVVSCVASILEHRGIAISGDGSQRRDLLYVGDICRLVKQVIEKGITGVFNAVTGCSCSVNDIVRILESHAGCSVPRVYDNKKEDRIDLVFDNSGILNALPGFSFTGPDEGLAKTYDDFKREHCRKS